MSEPLGYDDGLDAGGVAVGEGHHSHPLVGDSDACHGDVGLALLHAEQSGVKIHVVDLQLQAQLLGNGLCGVHIDALNGAGVGGHLVGREGGVGSHSQLASLNGGQLSSGSAGGSSLRRSSNRACSSGRSSGGGAAAGGQSQSSSGNSGGSQEAAARDLFHIQTLLFMCISFASLCCDAIHRKIRERV